ncbi:hypothetical protein [Neptunomonas sp.]|uniref:hypothetical protein n=1 Tax=Neptunomonas sp. TaxID=1971898 RepID=UPI003565A703
MKLGIRIQAAVACGITSKGPWRSSKTPGLYALRDGWVIIILSETPCAGPMCLHNRRVQGVVSTEG